MLIEIVLRSDVSAADVIAHLVARGDEFVKDFYDNRFLHELESSGFFRELYGSR